jgi:NifU-like protein involved in Fe-S cluster formation
MAPSEAPAHREALAAYLAGRQDLPERLADFSAFAPVRSHPSRQGCVLLPFEALIEAAAMVDPDRRCPCRRRLPAFQPCWAGRAS